MKVIQVSDANYILARLSSPLLRTSFAMALTNTHQMGVSSLQKMDYVRLR